MSDSETVLPFKFARGNLCMPIVCITAVHEGKRNIMTSAWCAPASFVPPLITTAIGLSRFTHDLVMKSGEFVLNIMASDQEEIAVEPAPGNRHPPVKTRSPRNRSGSTPPTAPRSAYPNWIPAVKRPARSKSFCRKSLNRGARPEKADRQAHAADSRKVAKGNQETIPDHHFIRLSRFQGKGIW